jgi:hypothetical protein
MRFHRRFVILIVGLQILLSLPAMFGQQKPQWLPGQVGLNAGILPSPGFSYVNITENYNADTYNDLNGKAVPATGSYDVWAVEDIFYYVLHQKILGGNLGFMIMFPTPATGSLVADIPNPLGPNLNVTGGGSGLADLWLQPFNLGWHLKRFDVQVNDGFMIPTGRYSAGASNNVGSGYFGNHFMTGTTFYITKNKGTSANYFTDWEVHGSRAGTNNTSKTPGQAFTQEWGVGQVLPLKKDQSQLAQLGVVGYDQWQVTDNGGTFPLGSAVLPANILPHYSVHAIGGEVGYILPAKNLSFFFKYYNEYSAASHTLGNSLVIQFAWTLPIPKPPPPKP